ncbi:siroheme synthase CysG [Acidomonas methanolica]|uniref:Siroheme synthase n=3 Tax=Acidomonas methanolica TaxID=437 RepID=A0A023D238_ACIMT|nr:siroheme synthase CysG [Acidomonas methanolica]MBU2654093.1 siroheme synthase CysG [Acidomonas methanolica]TCS30678.1 uroporphyrin-III C-methyltransferase/precorrin-2 dehydrogenase/sirohydrochlorin ferrochelatase [Acidomonas methanolica]GAJ28192.1 siroheme synthase [Acidomonas methanolica NBRC 104435]GEK98934.1 siroheme synthase [Acidomonas methanolica NBRC 104435]
MNDDAFLPVALRLDDAEILIVGGGGIAANKTRLVMSRGATIHVIARALGPEMRRWHEEGRFRLAGESVGAALLDALLPRMRAVFAATDDEAVNRLVADRARAHNVLVCAVDDPEPSSFITPAIIDRRPVQIAIMTGGAAPVLARRLRLQIEALLPEGLGRLARFMRGRRPWIRERLPEVTARRRAWEMFVDGPGAEAALAGRDDAAQAALERAVSGHSRVGEAWLVGAGPGDPDMLTLAALRLMQNCDSVLYDQLIPEAILERVRRDAVRVFVGKQKSRHSLPQAEINAELIRRAQAGERVLRLKGGDPFIFGRGGEEMEALLAAGVRVRVIPGITAASGCGALAGIPLTHRDCAQICVFLTGHARADGTLALDWPTLARRGQTLVIYMGLTPLAELCARLTEHGLPPDWPAAVIERGTRPDQRVHAGTLATLAALARERAVSSPALIIIGEVVRHRGAVG